LRWIQPSRPGDFSELRLQLVIHAVGGLLVLLTITALSVYKPWGRIGSVGEARAGRVTAICRTTGMAEHMKAGIITGRALHTIAITICF
jgi:hypothetical protein